MKYLNPLIMLVVALLSCKVNAMEIDGKLDEHEWMHAKKLDDFTVVSPFSLIPTEYKTEVRIFSNEKGIYIGITNEQPIAAQRKQKTTRDAHMDADYNNIVIDFNNDHLNAYSFTIANGGSIEDGIYRDENQYSYEWNGLWYSATSYDDAHWYVEVLIPWEVSPMIGSKDDSRNIGFYVSRHVSHLSTTYASSPTYYNRQRFLSEFPTLQVKDFAKGSIQVFGHITGHDNLISDHATLDAGLDIFWKINSEKQLSLSIRPDFGQVESDELVVNFSPIETFFSENRPFFTENQSVFDVRGAESLRLVHTRRIGAQPDSGDAFEADILSAVKFTSTKENLSYGIFSAIEDSSDQSDGRDFYVARIMNKQDDYKLGYLFTHTDRPDIDRSADVHAVDYGYDFNNVIKLTGQSILSQIEEKGDTTTGTATWINIDHQIDANWTQSIELNYFNDDVEANDLGFLPRNDLASFYYNNVKSIPNTSPEGLLKEHKMGFTFEHKENSNGLKLESAIDISDNWSWRNGSSWITKLRLNSDGYDDLITRGNNVLKTDGGYELSTTYYGKQTNNFRYKLQNILYNQTVRGEGVVVGTDGTYYINNNHSTSVGIWYTNAKDWLTWSRDNILSLFDQDQLSTRVYLTSSIGDRQEITFKFEWLAFRADFKDSFTLLENGNLNRTVPEESDFSLSNTALQVRYKYQISPLSNIYLVYSRGGNDFENRTHSYPTLLENGWESKTADNILFKLRYQF